MNELFSLLSLAFIFMKIGALTIGGGMAMAPVILSEMTVRGWMDESRFTEILGISEATPGPLAVNIATFVGYERLGISGAIFATLALAVPSFICVILLGYAGKWLKAHVSTPNLMPMLRTVVAGMIAAVAVRLSLTVLKSAFLSFSADGCVSVAVAVAVAICVISGKISPLAALLAGALVATIF